MAQITRLESVTYGSGLLAVLFFSLFLWSSQRKLEPSSACVAMELLPSNSGVEGNGYFDQSGKECVYRSTLPKVCRPYYEDVPDCPARRQRKLSTQVMFLSWTLPLIIDPCMFLNTCPPSPPPPPPAPPAPPLPPVSPPVSPPASPHPLFPPGVDVWPPAQISNANPNCITIYFFEVSTTFIPNCTESCYAVIRSRVGDPINADFPSEGCRCFLSPSSCSWFSMSPISFRNEYEIPKSPEEFMNFECFPGFPQGYQCYLP